ncbi:PQQ-like beta-propeller repeat protein [Actinocorallia sp. API 0066]|uniref:outer membrane protein assembly factor BamB family protein n=1 Tax=Actinocorallia sp. API 0066 TaxID=2896846 RepID=UPI001E2DC5DC|nr:PQQ-binding-like beta-propeller repeat protein [Actinocorallia sp. API 0066]MCD0447844.1 PQQ-like beta-propeller repeat protein [Actinocorallia sp. API 0066]
MARRAHGRSPKVIIPALAVTLLAGCSDDGGGTAGGTPEAASGHARWADTGVNAVSRPMTSGGVTAVTALTKDGTLQTVTYDTATGTRLWTTPSTMKGRPSSLGVAPPAVTGSLVATLEPTEAAPETTGGTPSPGAAGGAPGPRHTHGEADPRDGGQEEARRTPGDGPVGAGRVQVVARDARGGTVVWRRDVKATWGPVACGANVCLPEAAGTAKARFTVLEGASGKVLWRLKGVAEVQHVDAERLVLLRRTKTPEVSAHDPASGRRHWAFPLDNAVGEGADLDGGWASGVTEGRLLGYLGPNEQAGKLTPFGFFALDLKNGERVWSRPGLLRVYPGASPGVALVARRMNRKGAYGGFTRLDPRTGTEGPRIPASKLPKDTPWWLSFPADLSSVGFLAARRPGTAYSLEGGGAITVEGLRTWSFCTVTPSELRIKGGLKGFYPTASLCLYDLAEGRRSKDQDAAPPAWYTGSADGWRVWRDEQGALRAVREGEGTIPGMYGL